MALLNPPEVMPDVVRMLTEAVALRGPLSPQSLLDRIAPDSIGGDKSLAARASLRAALTLGFLAEHDSELICDPDVAGDARRFGTLRHDWSLRLLRAVRGNEHFEDAVKQGLGGANEQPGVRDLAYALTWFHAQDRYGLPLHWSAGRGRRGVEDLLAEQLDTGVETRATYPVVNDTRWNTFGRWALAMQSATVAPAGDGLGALVPDPSRLVRAVLVAAFRAGRVVQDAPVLDVCDVVAQEAPFLWRGALRRDLVEGLGRDPDPAAAINAIDTGLSAALLQLQARREIVILDQADASFRSILDASGPGRIGVTHIRFTLQEQA